jgi:hypothetical protein
MMIGCTAPWPLAIVGLGFGVFQAAEWAECAARMRQYVEKAGINGDPMPMLKNKPFYFSLYSIGIGIYYFFQQPTRARWDQCQCQQA